MTDNISVIIPMAGSGRRFREAGFTMPKPFIDVKGKPMIARVIENINIPSAKIFLIANRGDADLFKEQFKKIEEQYNCEFLYTAGLTEGAACTVLHAVAKINNDRPLLLANSDQLVDVNFQEFLDDAGRRNLDGSILTFKEPGRDPKWSYAATGDNGLVTEVREKVAISSEATVGIYWFAKGRYFVEAAAEMIAHNERCNNEFYVCPVYNYLLRRDLKIGTYEIDKSLMHGLGTPEDLQIYLKAQM